MTRTIATRTSVAAIGLGALLVPVLAAGTASADPDTIPWGTAERTPPPDPAALTSELLARGSAGEFHLTDEATGFSLDAGEPTDVAVFRATLAPHSSIGFHTHAGPSVVVVTSGTLHMVEPPAGGRHRCTEEVHEAGTAFPHPAGAHDFVNTGAEPVVFVVTYFVPEGTSPAPVRVDPPPRC